MPVDTDSLAAEILNGVAANSAPDPTFPWALIHKRGCGEIAVRLDRYPMEKAPVKLASPERQGICGFNGMMEHWRCFHCLVELTKADFAIENIEWRG